ncbi:uncharacterized protein F5891DRAFT_1192742 [Suillus fuscotomentosus]|uniref:Uncharacterized protein n=1 Tax=Suillus fuscotomentosus TaxID=1912939 RepID=A0AAD4DYV8_9AGAM|nr:uncharacterized protein F5891DRAFT_1192742 [Suillus fuscotomentosus]KAG1896635.1 hypothetical protein F5891DRAFT_1192742 [Suillus fuscotomentosus]
MRGMSLYNALKLNFHWAVHLRQQILDYGPVYNFWAFLSERLNKVLKSSNLNNWTGGQIEISMMREFAHGAQIDSLAHDAIANAESPIVKMLLECMLSDDHKVSGTIQDAAAGTGFDKLSPYLHDQPGPLIPNPQQLSDAARVALYTHYNSQQPHSVHYALEANPRPGSSQLNDFALYYQFTLLDERRISLLARSTGESAGSSLVKVAYMDKSCEDGAPPTVLPFDQITSQIARGIIKTSNPELWITTTLDRHPTV